MWLALLNCRQMEAVWATVCIFIHSTTPEYICTLHSTEYTQTPNYTHTIILLHTHKQSKWHVPYHAMQKQPLTPSEQRLLRHKPPHAPPPTSRLLRRLHPSSHLHPHQHLLLIHHHGRRPTQPPTTHAPALPQQHNGNLRLLVPHTGPLVPAHRGHLRAAAVPAAEPRG